MANFRKKLFTLLGDLSGSPILQAEAVDHVAEVTGMKPRLIRAEVKATKAAQAEQSEDAATVEEAAEGVAFVAPDRYWIRTPAGNEWERRTSEDVARKLRERGLSTRKKTGEELSAVDRALLHIQDNQSAHYAGPLTAWRTGLHTHGDARFVVTRQPKFIEPRQGDPGPFLRMVDDLVGVGIDPHAEQQRWALLGWFRQWLLALDRAATDPLSHVQGQALLIAGPPGLGKSVFTAVAARLGGDRSFDPERTFSKDSRFNAELAGATLATIHDATLPADPEGVRLFWGNVKKLVANRDHAIEVKYGDARTLPLAGLRGVVTCNFGDEAAKILAPVLLEDGMADKVLLLRGHPPAIPHPPSGSEAARAKLAAINDSLPAVAWFLRHELHLPAGMQDDRYGVATFRHPDILDAIRSNHPENALGDQIDLWLSHRATAGQTGQWEGTATELFHELKETLRDTFTRTTKRPQHLGHQLKRLRGQPGWAERLADRVVWVGAGANQEQRRWVIAQQGAVVTPPAA